MASISAARGIEFKRELRDCAHNNQLVDREEARLSRHLPRGDRRKTRPVYDYMVMVDGDQMGTMSRKDQGRGYRFLDLGGAPIEHPEYGHSVVSKDLFQRMVEVCLAAGVIPSIEEVCIRHGIDPASILKPSVARAGGRHGA